MAGALGIAAAAGIFSLRIWVAHYLKSPAFAEQLNETAGRMLQAECRLDGVTWQDSAMHAGTFTAHGTDGAVFRRLEVSDIRAGLDTGALWDRIWKVPQVRIPQAVIDFSPGGRAPARDFPPENSGAAGSAGQSGHWLARWLPDRAEIGPVQVDRFDFIRKSGDGTSRAAASGDKDGETKPVDFGAVEGRALALVLKPDLSASRVEIEGRGGDLLLPGVNPPLQLRRLRATLRGDAASLDQLEGTLAGATLSTDGTVALAPVADLRLNVRMEEVQLATWLPEDWLRRCDGQASLRARVFGDARKPGSLRSDGSFLIRGATLQALPMLDVIAKKTRNAGFLRLLVKEASGGFEYSGAGRWTLRRLRADAPGLLRLKGQAEIGTGGALSGPLLLGIVPGTLRYLAGAEQTVFVPASVFSAQPGNAGTLEADDGGLLWARFTLGGTLENPSEDLSGRLARAWFNATVEEVQALSMEAAATAARAAETAAGTAAGAADTLLQHAPPVLQQAPDLMNQGVKSGLNVLENLLPK